jgi:hypothetical protein
MSTVLELLRSQSAAAAADAAPASVINIDAAAAAVPANGAELRPLQLVTMKALWCDAGTIKSERIQRIAKGSSMKCVDEKQGIWEVSGPIHAVVAALALMAVANPYLSPVSAASVYATLVSQEEGDGPAGICLLVSDTTAGFLIGRKGKRIEEARLHYGPNVDIRVQDANPSTGPYRQVLVQGRPRVVVAALKWVVQRSLRDAQLARAPVIGETSVGVITTAVIGHLRANNFTVSLRYANSGVPRLFIPFSKAAREFIDTNPPMKRLIADYMQLVWLYYPKREIPTATTTTTPPAATTAA